MNRAVFYDALRTEPRLFSEKLSQPQVDGLEAILNACQTLPVSHQAYLLATAYHETGTTMQPVREAFGTSDADTIRKLDKALADGRLPQVSKAYWRKDASGRAWFGRGYVQLTHKANYEKAGALVGADLVADPSKALQPAIAARVLVEGCTRGIFTGRKLSDYLPGDYIGARRVVNGTDRAAPIAGYAMAFERALVAGIGSRTPAAPAVIAPPAPQPSFWARLIAAIFGRT